MPGHPNLVSGGTRSASSSGVVKIVSPHPLQRTGEIEGTQVRGVELTCFFSEHPRTVGEQLCHGDARHTRPPAHYVGHRGIDVEQAVIVEA